MELSKYNPDNEIGSVGVWVEFPVDDGDKPARFKIASNTNKKYRRAYDKAARDLAKSGRYKKTDESEAAQNELVAEGLLLDWEGVEDDGEPVGAYTPEKAIALFKKYPLLRSWVEGQAAEVSNFQKEKEAADLAASKSVAGI